MIKTFTFLMLYFALMATSATAQNSVDFRDALRMTFPATVSVSVPGQPDIGWVGQRNRIQLDLNQIGGLNRFPNQVQTLGAPTNQAGFAISVDKVITQLGGNPDEVLVTTFDKTEHVGKVISRDNVTGLCVVEVEDAELVSLLVDDGNPEAGLPVVTTWLSNGVGTSKSGMIASPPSSAQPRLGFTQQIDTGSQMQVTGSPIVDNEGVLVGITVAGQNGSVVCMPATQLTRLIDLALSDEPKNLERGMVGIQFNNDSGTVVIDVTDNSPGKVAGLEKGDEITQVNDHKVDTFQDVLAAVAMARAGDALQITFDRGDETMVRTVTLQDQPQPKVTLSALPNRAVAGDDQAMLPPMLLPGVFRQQGWILKDGKLVPMDLGGAPANPGDMEEARRQMETVMKQFTNPLGGSGFLNGFQVERSDTEAALQKQAEKIKELTEKLRKLEQKQ